MNKQRKKQKKKREEEVAKLRQQGWSYGKIGNYLNLSRARVHQIHSGYVSRPEISEEIMKRDNYTCQWQEKCKGNFDPDKLIVHHMDLNDRNNNPDNLITLCQPCHTYFHIKFIEARGEGHMPGTKFKKCLNCGKKNIIQYQTAIFCSPECHREYHTRKWTMKCANCGKVFIVPKTIRWNYYRCHKKFKENSYCSKKCFQDAKRIVFKTNVIQRYLEGEGSPSIATSEHCCVSTIRRHLVKNNIKIRKHY